MLPLARIIYERIGNDKNKRHELIKALGYTNLRKGDHALNELILGRYDAEIIGKLRQALDVDEKEFEEALRKNNAILEIERKIKKAEEEAYLRRTFEPNIEIKTEKRKVKGFIHGVGLLAFTKTKLDSDILNQPIEEQLRYIKSLITDRYSDYNEYHRYYESLGAIVSVKYHFSYDYFVEFDYQTFINDFDE